MAIDVVVMFATRAVALYLAGAFIVRYGRQDWRGTEEGRHLMGMTSVILGVLLYITLLDVAQLIERMLPWFDPGWWPGQYWLASGFNCWVGYELYRRNRLLMSARRRSDDTR